MSPAPAKHKRRARQSSLLFHRALTISSSVYRHRHCYRVGNRRRVKKEPARVRMAFKFRLTTVNTYMYTYTLLCINRPPYVRSRKPIRSTACCGISERFSFKNPGAEYNTGVQVRFRLSDIIIIVLASLRSTKDFQPKTFSHRHATRTTFAIIKRFDLFLSPVDTIKKYIIVNLIQTSPYIRDLFSLYELLGEYFSIFII